MRILLVDDDEFLMTSLAERLIRQRYAVDIAIDGSSAYDYVALFKYDLIVLDLMLPDGDGIEFCRRFRQRGYINPLMILSAKANTAQKVSALDAGADDYVMKPFDFDELCARIRALLRREHEGLPTILQWGDIQLDPSAGKLTYAQQPVRLTPKELALIELFLRHPYRIHSLGNIIDDLWSFEAPPSEDAIRTHVKSLRRKLRKVGAPKDLIKTVYGLGYRLNDAVDLPQLNRDRTDNTSAQKQSAQAKDAHWVNGSPDVCSSDVQALDVQALDVQALDVQALDIQQQRSSGSSSGSSFSDASSDACSYPSCGYLQRAQQMIAEVEDIAAPLLVPASEDLPGRNIHERDRLPQTLQDDAQSQVHMRLHKLAGSLGSFGLGEGSKLAQKIEEQLVEEMLLDPRSNRTAQPIVQNSGKASLNDSSRLSPYEITQLIQQLHHYIDVAARKVCPSPEDGSSATDRPAMNSDATATAHRSAARRLQHLLVLSDDNDLINALTQVADALSVSVGSSRSAPDPFLSYLPSQSFESAPDLIIWDATAIQATSGDANESALPIASTPTTISASADIPVLALVEAVNLALQRQLVAQGVRRVMCVHDTPTRLIQEAKVLLAEGDVKTIRIAIADDDPAFLAQFEACADDAVFSIASFTSAQAVWQWLHEVDDSARSRQLDVLILDIEMPGMSGLELCKVLRADAQFQRLPIVFLTVHDSEDMREAGFQSGADDFICKTTTSPAELAHRIQSRCFRRCAPVSI